MTALREKQGDDDVLTAGGLVNLNGAAVRFDASGVLHWPEERLLVVADLHFEKGSSHGVRGRFVPPYDTRATLRALAEVIGRLRPERVIALGDSFHDGDAEARLAPADLEALSALVGSVDWTWVAGNHDPSPPAGLGGRPVAEIVIGPLVFRHEPRPGRALGEVAGHLHPAAKVGRTRSVRRRAFVCDGSRCLLPAFGAYTGGLNVMDAAFKGLFERSRLIAWMLSDGRVYPVRSAEFLPD
ncbi:ligase-associated DNA damage response endonuclease PdeM [Pleomorphomonas sp. JP5]|uniref:ligase-associated DNA damage response endonuclease PdeM n=1 Tax=Pleomorphomonas sp. JP5 TaxID=2942998 RepID=UPI002043C46D|nr:ligase-associated DNA damage response endonuclease PdeM [Pleomorphomonas sp. JP5]MCM5558184.1 ligase-associated DNA damage response endonuclease PdeM [Pleomorphomonas sp. JP5]